MEKTSTWAILLAAGLSLTGCHQGYLDGASAEAPVLVKTQKQHFSLWLQNIGKPWLTNHGEILNLKVKLSNTGLDTLTSSGPNPINIGEILVNPDGSDANHDYSRSKLPGNLEPGKSTTTVLSIPTQQFKGNSINLQAVQEGVAWLEGIGSNVLKIGPYTECPINGVLTICDDQWRALPNEN